MTVLSLAEVDEALKGLPQWKRKGDAIERNYEFKTFVDAMAFVNKVADAAESADHHPDIDVRYNKVRLALTSHDLGGVTRRDLKMAARISELS